jgi:hypothetical protein
MIRDLIDDLPEDPWRRMTSFSPGILACHEVLFRAGASRVEMEEALNQWLAMEQPCLFGRMEAKQGRLVYCVLTENDLQRGDDHVRARIHEDRDAWRRLARTGRSHAFLIVAISSQIAFAAIGPELLRLAQHLCFLYLGQEELDRIFHDGVILEIRGSGGSEDREWKVGVNFFSAQGDGRWWRDHRFPGGIAYSMNSVGHMARFKAEEMLQRNAALAEKLSDVPHDRLVYWALPTAMRTIGPPRAGSTRGTWLGDRGRFPEDQDRPSFEVRERVFRELVQYSENRYLGSYHTDQTIPSAYFDPQIGDLVSAEEQELFFTYLHSPRDEDYLAMGIGTLARAIEEEQAAGLTQEGSEP